MNACVHLLQTNNSPVLNTDPPNMLAPLTVAIDAGWQKRASGRAYNSISGHVFAVGARTKLVLNRIVYGQRCRQCDTAEALGAKAAEHRCPKNYEGSSKGMEPTGAAFLVQSLYEHSKCYVSTVVTDDDSSIRAVLRHSYNALVKSGRWESKKGCWPRNTKGAYLKDHGKLPINMPQVDVQYSSRTRLTGRRHWARHSTTQKIQRRS